MTPPSALPPNEDGTPNMQYPKFRLKEIRDEQGITQAELARRVGVSCGYLSQLEGGYRRVNSDLLFNIVCALNVSLCELYDPMGLMIPEMLVAFRGLPQERQEIVLKFAQEQLAEHKAEKKVAVAG
jgi:transcriptional regulator with XRE-family HTH domain